MTKQTAGQIASPGRRAACYWFDDGYGSPCFLLSRKDAHAYSLRSVLPITGAGFLLAFLELPPEVYIVVPACILGAWFLIRGTWTLTRFIKSHPHLNNADRRCV